MSRATLTLLILGLLAHFFVLREYIVRMSGQEHYQFFPFAIAGAVWLFYVRRKEIIASRSKPDNDWLIGCFATVAITVAAATLINSSFLGWVSLILFLGSMTYLVTGWNGLRNATPALLALVLIIPLPGQVDKALILQMQYVASHLASWMLDAVGVFHFRQGVVLVSETENFLAEEACSGIRSLFSSVFVVVFLGMLRGYPWWRQLVNLVQVVGWVIVVNAARIATVVWVEDKTDFSVATGLFHELVGLAAFFLIVGMAFSFDRMVSILIPEPLEEESIDDEFAPKSSVPESSPKPILASKLPFQTAWLVAFGLIAFAGIRLSIVGEGNSVVESLISMESPQQEDLPKEINNWKLVDFKQVTRSRDDIQGQESFVWSMLNGPENGQLSLDCQWNDFHDLSYCYSGLGWQVETDHQYQDMFSSDTVPNDGRPNYTRLTLSKPTGERGIVLFCGLDRNGTEVQPPVKLGQNTIIHLWEKSINSIRIACGMTPKESVRLRTFRSPVTTLQLLYVPSGPVDESVEKSLESVFLAARQHAKQSQRFQSN